MANNGSSGKQTIDDERQFKKIEQWLDRINETLRNLTQMVAALTIEGTREPMKRQPDQRGDWQEDGYDDQRRPQVVYEINGGGTICTNPTTNRDFHDPYLLQVYDQQNREAPRHHDDDNL